MPSNKKAAKTASVRRAIFVIDHPELGTSVISRVVFLRNKFSRKFLHHLDECGRRGNLVETAQSALKTVFRTDGLSLQRRGMFPVRGLLSFEATVFTVDALFLNSYRQLPHDCYDRLEEHPFRAHIQPLLLSEASPVVRKKALG